MKKKQKKGPRPASDSVKAFRTLKKDGMLSSSKVIKQIEQAIKQDPAREIEFIPSLGIKDDHVVCSKCGLTYPVRCYKTRVTEDGYYQPSNKRCTTCQDKHAVGREEARKQCEDDREAAKQSRKPKPGEVCLRCGHEWQKGWHFHHTLTPTHPWDNKYICSQCNLRMDDDVNPSANHVSPETEQCAKQIAS